MSRWSGILARLAFSVVLTLLLVEAGLALVPQIMVWRRKGGAAALAQVQTALYFIGDSVPAGSGVNLEQNYPSRVRHLLTARGFGDRVAVYNLARSGASSSSLVEMLRVLEEDPSVQQRLVIAQIGHNDFVMFTDEFQGDGQNPTLEPGVVGPRSKSKSWFSELRIWRLLKGVFRAARHMPPTFHLSAPHLKAFRYNILYMAKQVRAAGGTLIMTTYLVPHSPPKGAPKHVLKWFSHSNSTTLRVNQITRAICEKYNIPLIDLQRLIAVPRVWSRGDGFLDNIHITPALHDQVAEAIVSYLLLGGVLNELP